LPFNMPWKTKNGIQHRCNSSWKTQLFASSEAKTLDWFFVLSFPSANFPLSKASDNYFNSYMSLI
jgi:hypothetical protein